METKKDLKYNVDEISNKLGISEAGRFFLLRIFKESTFSLKDWEKNIKKHKVI